MKWGVLRGVAALLVSCAASVVARAHDLSVSLTSVQARPDRVEVRLNMAAETAWTATERAIAPGVTYVAEDFANVARPHLLTWAQQMMTITLAGQRLVPERVEVTPIEDHFEFAWDFARPAEGGLLNLEETYLPAMPAGYLTKIEVRDEAGDVVVSSVLDADNAGLEITLGRVGKGLRGAVDVVAPPPTFGRYFRLGAEHILLGFDHLLFLAGLLLVCRRLGTALVIISCFTLAHSLTLALAALDVVTLPSRWVEAVIAASIVYVGLENFARKGEPRGRGVLTLAFGLVHGFGFAGVLKDLGLGTDGGPLLGPLFAFNLGIELGQIAVAAVALPMIWHLQKRPAYERRILPILSGLVAVAGAVWLVERLLSR